MDDKALQLSAIIITCNAEAGLARCLESLQGLVAATVVVDSGSTDSTLKIAKAYGATVIEQPWLGFGPQKRLAVKASPTDWVLCIDSDEWLSDELRQSIARFMADPTHKVCRLVRCNRFLGRFLRHGEGYPDRIVRLFHRDFAQWSDDLVHEKVVTASPIAQVKGDLYHDSAEDLETYLAKQNRYTSVQAEKLVAEGKVPSRLKAVISPAFRFIRGYVFKLGFLDGFPGFVHMAISASNSFYKLVKAIDLRRKRQTVDFK